MPNKRTEKEADDMWCMCGRPIRAANPLKTPFGWEHADGEGGVVCEDGYLDSDGHWVDSLFCDRAWVERDQ